MRLWTIQPAEIMDMINSVGKFTCDINKNENYEDFKEAYLWLVSEMDKRGILRPEGLQLPLWAWHTRNWKHKKPDLRESGLGCKGEKSVCIEFEIDDNAVLLSDFDNWHGVLNKWWLDGSKSETECDKLWEWYEKQPRDVQKKLMVESWQKIFDIEPEENEWFSKGRYVQATFWELRKEMIRQVKYFTAR